MRQIVLDTETTGLAPEDGHRIIEIGCVELIDRKFTGNNFHRYINPEREIEFEAQQVHGITSKFLADKPLFAEIIDGFVDYIKGAELIIHNAPFDVGFLNHEFKLYRNNHQSVAKYSTIFDTLAFARKRHPGKRNSLDALCKRYHVDNSGRKLHGALLDATLLAEVYIAMTGGQMSLFGDSGQGAATLTPTAQNAINAQTKLERAALPIIYATAEELAAHSEFIALLGEDSLWNEN